NLSIGQRRMEGYKKALQKYHIDFDENLILTCTNDNEHNYQQLKSLLMADHSIDGIFASVERLAITSYYVCHDLQIPIPQRIKVIGFSNLATAPLLSPSLTTITQPAFEIGEEAAKLLFKGLKKYNKFNTDEKIVLN